MSNNLREKVYLAALLHDIGKFFQRADENGVARSNLLTGNVKDLESALCPISPKGYRTHKHVLYTAQFIDNIYPHLANILALENENRYSGNESLIRLAAAHHAPNPSNPYEVIIQKADHYASGMDRTSGEAFKDVDAEHKWDDFKRTTMRSIFEQTFKKSGEYKYRLPLNALSFNSNIFPQQTVDKGNVAYAQLWREFENELKHLQTHSTLAFAESILYLLHKYTLHIPSSTINFPDVSLYDHLKVTGAFALCLLDFYNENGSMPKQGDSPFILIGADVSGIQNYLYSIVSSGASKNLKGRSHYLQMLIDSVAERLLNDLGLFSANLIYASGGGFYLLAPNTKQTASVIESFSQELSIKAYEAHQTELSIALAAVEFGEQQVFEKTIGSEVWQQLTEQLNQKKRSVLANELKLHYNNFFEPIGVGAMAKRDDITGEELAPEENSMNFDGMVLKPHTYDQIMLGKILKDTDYHVISKKPITYWDKDITGYNVLNLGVYHYFLNKEQLAQYRDKLKATADDVRVLAVNDANFLESTISGIENIYGFKLYGGNKPPLKDNGNTLTFDELAEGDALKRLGVLRMDVDNLGQVFINGFPKEKRSFSKYSTLSRNLDFFFKGYLNEIWNRKESYRKSCFIIYSGGDDLFIIGKWNILLEFAIEIQKEFTAFVCHNEGISISGGMALVTGKFPIIKAAELAAAAESEAKDHEIKVDGKTLNKNSLTILGLTLNFNHELPTVINLKEEIKALYESNVLPKAFGSKVSNYSTSITSNLNKSDKTKLHQWKWLMAYDFARMADRNKGAKNFLDKMYTAAFTNNYEGLQTSYQFIEILNLANRLAQLELRT